MVNLRYIHHGCDGRVETLKKRLTGHFQGFRVQYFLRTATLTKVFFNQISVVLDGQQRIVPSKEFYIEDSSPKHVCLLMDWVLSKENKEERGTL